LGVYSKQMSDERVLLLGFGDIAQRLAKQCVLDSASHYVMVGVKRTEANNDYVDIVQADVGEEAEMDAVLQEKTDVIIITMTPSEMSDEGYRKAYVETSTVLLRSLSKQSYQPRLIVFVSSTGVYGQQNAEWVLD